MKKIYIIPVLVLLAAIFAACSAPGTATPDMVGEEAPDFTLDNALGGETSLSDFQGQPVLLYFHMAVG